MRVRAKEQNDARSLGVSDMLAIDDDKAIETFRLVDAIAETVDGEVAAKLIAKESRAALFATPLSCRRARRPKIRQ